MSDSSAHGRKAHGQTSLSRSWGGQLYAFQVVAMPQPIVMQSAPFVDSVPSSRSHLPQAYYLHCCIHVQHVEDTEQLVMSCPAAARGALREECVFSV